MGQGVTQQDLVSHFERPASLLSWANTLSACLLFALKPSSPSPFPGTISAAPLRAFNTPCFPTRMHELSRSLTRQTG
jgi:hypothetical protein